eukprot:gene13878-29533_t
MVLHAQLWFGRGSVPQVANMKQQLAAQELANRDAQQRNDQLASEVRDLQEGLDMVEELARAELGMVKSRRTSADTMAAITVALLGGESSGKTTLGLALIRQLNALG